MFGGDEKAARDLLERYHRPLYGTLLRLTRNPADAEELFQETFLRAFRAGAGFDPSRRFKPWLFAIAVNLARDRASRKSHRATPELRAPEDLPECTERRTERVWNLRFDLERALAALPEHHRRILELRYFAGMEEPEIAAAVDVPRGTVKSRLHYAVRKMREIMTAGETT